MFSGIRCTINKYIHSSVWVGIIQKYWFILPDLYSVDNNDAVGVIWEDITTGSDSYVFSWKLQNFILFPSLCCLRYTNLFANVFGAEEMQENYSLVVEKIMLSPEIENHF